MGGAVEMGSLRLVTVGCLAYPVAYEVCFIAFPTTAGNRLIQAHPLVFKARLLTGTERVSGSKGALPTGR